MYRVQRTRKTAPGIPLGAVYIGRPTIYGNPFVIGSKYNGEIITRQKALEMYYEHLKKMAKENTQHFLKLISDIENKNLCCWCSLTEQCHGDILILISQNIGTIISSNFEIWPDFGYNCG